MKKIYIAHCFGGKQENADKVANIIRKLVIEYPDMLFISPIHTLGFLYNDVGYIEGMEYCFELLSLCDEMWVCSEDSKGVLLEKEYCKQYNISIVDKVPRCLRVIRAMEEGKLFLKEPFINSVVKID